MNSNKRSWWQLMTRLPNRQKDSSASSCWCWTDPNWCGLNLYRLVVHQEEAEIAGGNPSSVVYLLICYGILSAVFFFFPFSLLFFIILMLLTISYKGSQWSNQNPKIRNMKMSCFILIVRTQPRLQKSCYRKENWNRNILCPILKGKRAKDKTTQNKFVLFHTESVLLGRGYVWAHN